MASSHCRATPQKLYNYLGKIRPDLFCTVSFKYAELTTHVHMSKYYHVKIWKMYFKTDASARYIFKYLITTFCGFTDDKIEIFLGSYDHCRSPMLRSHYLKNNKKFKIILYLSWSCAPWDFGPLSHWHWNFSTKLHYFHYSVDWGKFFESC